MPTRETRRKIFFLSVQGYSPESPLTINLEGICAGSSILSQTLPGLPLRGILPNGLLFEDLDVSRRRKEECEFYVKYVHTTYAYSSFPPFHLTEPAGPQNSNNVIP